jgi:putative tryptophan/tyrosine transport system substrate-binding protein
MIESPPPLTMLLSRHTRRRAFLAVLGSATLVRPTAAVAEKARRVGMLMPFAEHDPEALIRVAAFSQKLQELGWVVGRNIRLVARWSESDAERTRKSAAELAATTPDVILAAGMPALVAIAKETHSVPVVFVAVPDPVGQGLVAGLARPGGNATGFANLDFPVDGKWLELLNAAAPAVTRVLLLFNPDAAADGGSRLLRLLKEAAGPLRLDSIAGPVRAREEIERAVETFAQTSGGGLLVLPDNVINANRERIVTLAEQHRLPAIYPSRVFVTAGGCCPTVSTCSTCIGARPATSTASSRAPSPAICRCSNRRGSSSPSTSRPLERSASNCRSPFWRAPTR